ncbi:hypothetical protein ABZZ80_04980, partial [Streptomyces sp. NPDC006356]
MGRPGLNRRQLLATAGGLAVAGSFGFAALGTGADALASNARTRVRYWNLFSGGGGGHKIAVVGGRRGGPPPRPAPQRVLGGRKQGVERH